MGPQFLQFFSLATALKNPLSPSQHTDLPLGPNSAVHGSCEEGCCTVVCKLAKARLPARRKAGNGRVVFECPSRSVNEPQRLLCALACALCDWHGRWALRHRLATRVYISCGFVASAVMFAPLPLGAREPTHSSIWCQHSLLVYSPYWQCAGSRVHCDNCDYVIALFARISTRH